MGVVSELMEQLDLLQRSAPQSLPALPRPHLKPAMSDYLQPYLTLGFLEKCLVFVLRVPLCIKLLIWWTNRRNAFVRIFGTELKRSPSLAKRTGFVPIELSRDELLRLTRRCRENYSTVHGAVKTAGMLAYASICQGGAVRRRQKIEGSTSVDVRRWFLHHNQVRLFRFRLTNYSAN